MLYSGPHNVSYQLATSPNIMEARGAWTALEDPSCVASLASHPKALRTRKISGIKCPTWTCHFSGYASLVLELIVLDHDLMKVDTTLDSLWKLLSDPAVLEFLHLSLK